jgi:hypothetical protein
MPAQPSINPTQKMLAGETSLASITRMGVSLPSILSEKTRVP